MLTNQIELMWSFKNLVRAGKERPETLSPILDMDWGNFRGKHGIS